MFDIAVPICIVSLLLLFVNCRCSLVMKESCFVTIMQYSIYLLVAPTSTNGIITSYSLYLRYVIPCSQSTDQDICDYIECSLGESRCGSQCYMPATHACCQDTLYLQAENHACCGSDYIERGSGSDVCCGGSFYALLSGYTCCGGLYQAIGPGDVCCDDGNTASIGSGNFIFHIIVDTRIYRYAKNDFETPENNQDIIEVLMISK